MKRIAAADVQRPSATACAARVTRRARRSLLSSRSSLILGCSQSGLTRAANSGGSCARNASASTGCGSGPHDAAAGRRPLGRAAVVQEQVELVGDELARLAEPVEQRAGCRASRRARGSRRSRRGRRRGSAGRASAGRRGTGCGARSGAAACRPSASCSALARLHQAAGGELVERLQRRARADLGELAAAHDQQQLDDELDLADAAARELDVVGALRPAGGAALRFVAHLGVQLAQALEHAVVEIAAVDEGGDERAQRRARGRSRRWPAARRRGSSARRSAPTRGRAPAGTPRASPG